MQKLSVLGTLASASIRSELQYRANAVSSIIGGILFQITGFVVVWIIAARFGQIGGWGLPELTFLYGMRLTSHGIFYACFSQMFEFDRVLITGEFDRYLVRPMPPLIQLFTRKLRINAFGDLIGGTVLVIAASTAAPVDWSPLAVTYLILAMIGGGLVEGAVQITLGSLSFRFLQTLPLRSTVNEVFNLYGNYPNTIFPGALRWSLTFLLPIAFVAFFPASVLLNRAGELSVPLWLAAASPLVGMVLFSIAVRVWKWQSVHYQSSGN
ncbi:MAG: ABC-2 family transporter protein [Thermomicrobiales bacterium]|nr:ABC-2 family transporter protein [Thermomicrobiales bacterium]